MEKEDLMSEVSFQVCSQCEREKPLEDFYRHRNHGPHGRDYRCKDCSRVPTANRKVRSAKLHGPYEQNGVGIVPLNHGVNAYVDVADLPAVAGHLWHCHKPKGSRTSYAEARIGGVKVRLHRHLMFHGSQDDTAKDVDHVDGDGLNNRRSNLRVASRAENIRNTTITKANKSGYIGVGWHRASRLWRARGSNSDVIGYYHTAKDAARARDMWVRQHHGEYATYNFPPPGCRSAITGKIRPTEFVVGEE
jgi:hypothetical protein